MNILQVCSLLQLLKQETVSFADIGTIIGISRQYVSKMKNEELDDDKLKLIETNYNVKLPRNFDIIEKEIEERNIENIDVSSLDGIKSETKLKDVVIHYWDGCVDCKEKIINPYFSELMLDMQKIINVYGANPENLAIISMLGDEMDGGTFPIKNNDILVIDTSINDLSSTGIYFCISDNGLFVRRLAQLIGDDSIYISVDNPLYTDVLNKTLSNDQLNSMGFKVIGKVIGNESIKL